MCDHLFDSDQHRCHTKNGILEQFSSHGHNIWLNRIVFQQSTDNVVMQRIQVKEEPFPLEVSGVQEFQVLHMEWKWFIMSWIVTFLLDFLFAADASAESNKTPGQTLLSHYLGCGSSPAFSDTPWPSRKSDPHQWLITELYSSFTFKLICSELRVKSKSSVKPMSAWSHSQSTAVCLDDFHANYISE